MAEHGLLWSIGARIPLLGSLLHMSDPQPDCGAFKGGDGSSAYVASRYFRSKRTGLLVFHRSWDVASPRGVVYIAHGLAEYCERYENVAAALNAAGLGVYSLDHQGHGKSEGSPRMYFGAVDELVSDFLQLVHEVRPTPPGLPRFLLGHSLGSLISMLTLRASMALEDEARAAPGAGKAAAATATAGAAAAGPGQVAAAGTGADKLLGSLAHQYHLSPGQWQAGAGSQPGWGGWAGVVLSGTMLVGDPSIDTPFNRFLAKALSSILPKLEVQGLDSNGIAADKEVVLQYQRDPLIVHGQIRVRVGAEFYLGMDQARAWAPSATLPLLCMHGEGDSITNPAGSKWLIESVASKDKTLLLYPGLKHEIFNEKEGAKVTGDMVGWVQKHL